MDALGISLIFSVLGLLVIVFVDQLFVWKIRKALLETIDEGKGEKQQPEQKQSDK